MRGLSGGGSMEGALPAGELISGRYRIVRLLGRGGMGVVYHADDLTLGVPVALKFLSEQLQHDTDKLERFLNEVRLARQISHPNVCRVFDVAEVDGEYFLSMEWVDGEDLASLLKRVGRLPRGRALKIGLDVCRGLEAAHEQGILHRDLKPANLMIDADGRARITDFGLAALAGEPEEAGEVAGTLLYMAPEQGLGSASVKSDLFSLGLVLYELLCGERAFDRPQVFRHQDPDTPRPMSERDLDPAVERVVLACLEARPEKRPSSALVVASVLERAAAPPWRPAPGAPIPHRNHWQLEKRLGEGGFGEAWLAMHGKTRQQRVFKFCNDVTRLRSFEREITLFRLLMTELGKRDDIVSLVDWSLEEPPYFIEAEYTAGGNLRQWVERQGGAEAVSLEGRIELAAQVATALAAAHSVGVIHKDVKPSNVLVRESDGGPRAQLCDFGIAAAVKRDVLEAADITVLGLTELGDTSSPSSYGGTRLYAAPEVLEGREATVKSDVYSLGVVLYQLVVGDFRRSIAPGWRRDVADELLADDIAAAVDGQPEHRPTAAQLAEHLRALPERRQQAEHEEQLRQEAERARRELERVDRRRRWVAVGLGFLLVLAAVLAYAFEQGSRSARDAMITQTLNGLEGMASVTASALGKNLAAIERRITREAQRQRLTEALAEGARDELAEHLGVIYRRYADRSFYGWILADRDGAVLVCRSGRSEAPGACLDELGDGWFAAAGDGPRDEFGLEHAFRAKGGDRRILMHAASPVRGEDGAVDGVLSTAVDLGDLLAWMGEAEADDAVTEAAGEGCPDRFLLLVFDGQLVRHPCPEPAAGEAPMAPEAFLTDAVRQLLDEGTSRAFRDPLRPSVDDDLAIVKPLGPESPWRVIVVQNREAALRPLAKLTRRVRLLGRFATAVAVGLFLFLVVPALWRARRRRT